jgi:hypothetical protein
LPCICVCVIRPRLIERYVTGPCNAIERSTDLPDRQGGAECSSFPAQEWRYSSGYQRYANCLHTRGFIPIYQEKTFRSRQYFGHISTQSCAIMRLRSFSIVTFPIGEAYDLCRDALLDGPGSHQQRPVLRFQGRYLVFWNHRTRDGFWRAAYDGSKCSSCSESDTKEQCAEIGR